MKDQLKKWLSNPLFWILFLFLIRLVGITNPPLEASHNWRQATGLMVAHNFLEIDPNILYPRVDDTGNGTGIIGMEFPSLNYLYHLLSLIFGYTHWYGRLINLVVTSIGLFFFSRILEVLGFGKKIVLAATIILGVSIWFHFARKMMPDTYCISLMMVAIYYGLTYLESKTSRGTANLLRLTGYVVFASLAILSKIPAGIYFALFLFPFLDKEIKISKKIIVGLASLIPLVLMWLWYFVWDIHLSKEFGNWYNEGVSLTVGARQIWVNLSQALHRFYFDAFESYTLFAIFLVGLFFMIKDRNRRLITIFGSVFFVYLVYILKSGFFFYHHDYYIIPVVPVMALVASYGLSKVKKEWLFISLLIIGSGEAIANQQNDFFTKKSELYKMDLEPILNQVAQRKELIIINGNGNQQMVYLAHHKGWNADDDQISDWTYLKDRENQGAKLVVVLKDSEAKINPKLKKVYEDDHYFIGRFPNEN